MKTYQKQITKPLHGREEGSILMVSALTITILTLLCAISLNVASQNGNATTQTTSWQQSLAGAEAGADLAMNALNTGSWNGWYTVTGTMGWTLPTPTATPFPAATGAPTSGQYNYYIPSALTLQGEAGNSVSTWVAIAPVAEKNNIVLTSLQQPYRIRAVGTVIAPGPPRVSNQKRDNDLRKIALKIDRFTGGAVTPTATRRVELIANPVNKSIWGRGISLKSWINMSGGGTIDSFDSTNSLKSTNGLYDVNKRQSHGEIATINSTLSDLHSTYVYGNVQYSGPAIKNTTNVKGTISTPFNAVIPATVDPVAQSPGFWYDNSHDGVQSQPNFTTSGTPNYTAYAGGSPPVATITATGNANSPNFIKINGDLTVPGGQTLTIASNNNQNGNQADKYVTIWVTGKFTTSGTGLISQDSNVHVVWIIDGDITTSGGSYNNQSGRAGMVSFIGVGTSNKVTVSGSANFIGTINAPGYDTTISGSGNFSGALIAKSLTISGGASFHYDEALALGAGSGSSVSNYAYASWFEDNSDSARSITY